MRMKDLAHASIHQLSLLELQISPWKKTANHRYVMRPKPVERFVYVIRGKGCFSLENKEICVKAKEMLYLPGETAYRSRWPEDSEFMVIDLLLHDAEGNPIRFEETPGILFYDSHSVYLGLLKELAAKSEAEGPFDWLDRLSLSFKLLYEMAQETNRSELDGKKRKIKAALTYLQNNYREDFSVEQLAKMCCLSTGRFRFLFTECMGVSPLEYRNRLRAQKAMQLLKTGEYNVGETAELVGIRDPKYFSKFFFRYTGITPGSVKNK